MALDYDKIMSIKNEPTEFTYDEDRAILYALGVGFGRDPLDANELNYVYEKNMRAVPTMASVLGGGGGGGPSPLDHVNFAMVLHGEQRLTVHNTIPPAATVISEGKLAALVDKGDKGAYFYMESSAKLKETGEPLWTTGNTILARADGNFGGPTEGGTTPHKLPEREPEKSFEVSTRDDQALLYALSGDHNPLHRDPEMAKVAGFPKPIIHGMCTYGTACRGILTHICDYDNTAIRSFDARFSTPMFPGETIVIDTWQDGNILSFRCRVKERNVICLTSGKCTLA